MQIQFKTKEGLVRHIDVAETDTIIQMKTKIREQNGVSNFKLLFIEVEGRPEEETSVGVLSPTQRPDQTSQGRFGVGDVRRFIYDKYIRSTNKS